MSTPHRVGDLDIPSDMRFHRRSWGVQRVSWAAMALALAAALGGLFGVSPLSGGTLRAADGGVTLEYRRFWRWQKPQALVVRVAAGQPLDTVRVWLSRAWLARNTVQAVVPEPTSVALDRDRVIWTIAVRNGGGAITFDVRAERPGILRGTVGLVNGPTLAFRQFIYP